MPESLALWAATSSRELAEIDFGSVPKRTSQDVAALRVKNQSSTYTAYGVSVSAIDDDFAEIYLSLDGQNFFGEVDLGDLPAGAVSSLITIRRTTPSTASVGAHTCNLRTRATAWASPSTA